jgi:ABC-type transport system involved in cytochrome bd biosynthesis fused ATPase/permease subunit
MSIYDQRGALSEGQQQWLRERIEKSAASELEQHFSSFDKNYSSVEYQKLHEVYGNFLAFIYDQAAKREPLDSVDRQIQIESLTEALQAYYAAATAADDRMLRELLEADPSDARDPMISLAEDIASLEAQLDLDLDDQERAEVEQALHESYAQAEIFRANIASGAWRSLGPEISGLAPLSAKERQDHLASVCEFKNRSVGRFDARSVAESIVDEYNRQLVAHKVLEGVRANYSNEEIIAHLQQVLPSLSEEELSQRVDYWRERTTDETPDKITDWQAYTKILKLVYGDHPISATAFASSAALLGGLAPKMGEYLGEFFRTGSRELAAVAGGFGVASNLGQVELDRRLGLFLNERINSEAGIGNQLFRSVIATSPEIFEKKDLAWVRKYADETRTSIEQVAESTVTDIGARLARIIALSSAMALRLENPTLFLPCLVATSVNVALAMRGDQEIGNAGWAVREAASEFTSVIDQAMEVRATRGKESSVASEVITRLEAAKQKMINTMAKYQGIGALVLPGVLVGNAMLLDTQKTDFAADFAEATIYSMQLSQELTELVKQISRTRQALRPVVDFANTINEFRESGNEVPTDWRIEMRDVKRKALRLDSLIIDPGDLLVLVGEQGAGKSTLLEAIYGFGLERGLLSVDGIESHDLDKQAYRDQIMFANQFYALESKSLRDNVIGEDLPVNEEALRQVAHEFGFDRVLQQINSTREVSVADPLTDLLINKDFEPSGGERKMFALMSIDYRLRVAPETVKIIILDEPTSGVDALHKRDVFEVIARWRRDYPDKTVIIVNHDEHLFDNLPPETRIIGFEKGKSLVQDETLGAAREHPDAPFGKLFGVTGSKE